MVRQFLKFGMIGISNSFVNFCVYNGCLLILKTVGLSFQFDYLIAQWIGFFLSVLWSFVLNRKFVFNSEAERAVPWQKALVRMYLSYGFTGLGLNSILSTIWIYVFGIPKELVSLINDIIAFPVNFLLNKFWSFGKK